MSRFDVTIAGEINLDLILYGLEEQMPLDRELIANDFQLTLGSSSAILAHNLSCLGLRVGFISKVGPDPLGQIAIERLEWAGVDVSRTAKANHLQTGVTVLLHHGATRHILTYPGTMAAMTIADLDIEYLADSRHLHISSLYLQKGLQHDLPALCRDLRRKGLTISLDTNDDPEDKWGAPLPEMLRTIDIFLPNEDEAKRITRCDDLEEAIQSLAALVPVVAVKCGRKGSIVQSKGERWEIAPPKVEVVDTIGAGDSYNAGFLKGYLQHLPLARCAEMGNITAALSTLRPGGTEAYREVELKEQFLAKFPGMLDQV